MFSLSETSGGGGGFGGGGAGFGGNSGGRFGAASGRGPMSQLFLSVLRINKTHTAIILYCIKQI